MLFNFVSAALLLASLVLGEARFERVQGEKVQGSYIVKLKPGLSREGVLSKIVGVRHTYDKNFYNGFAGDFDEKTLELLRADPSVETIYEDGVARIFAKTTQTGATWGLERISQRAIASSPYTYTYDTVGNGSGVDVYVVDTGIYVAHSQFEGRARFAASFATGYPALEDNNGHGTHCAGTVGSILYGVAKKANLIAVKVLGDGGSGAWADVIAGINYVVQQKNTSGRPTVISMSLGGGTYQPVDDAVAAATAAGVHFVVAAGNSASDAKDFSPARSPTALTVGASDVTDTIAYFSNFGTLVDVFGPGVDVLSTYIGSTTATATLSGTSMAAPHLAGLVAYYISLSGNKTPADMVAYIRSTSTKNALKGLPSGTANYLAYNSANGKVSTRRDMLSRNMFE